MPAELAQEALASRVRQSALTNGSRATLSGDRRSAGQRRLRDLCKALAAKFGGMTDLPIEGQLAVETLAGATVELEILMAKRANGEDIDPRRFVTVANNQRRAMRELRAYEPPTPAPLPPEVIPSVDPLAEHLARNYGQRAEAAK